MPTGRRDGIAQVTVAFRRGYGVVAGGHFVEGSNGNQRDDLRIGDCLAVIRIFR